MLGAFIEAGVLALISIAMLLWLVLGRLSDMLLTLIPLATAGVVTMEICALLGWPLNFANIIAFPLLLGVGVAFKIYYIMAWRNGVTHLLQTSLTRAVIFSAMTTAVAFGSLMFSSHPGHGEHGAPAGAVAGHHALRGGAVPADPDGQAAASGGAEAQ